MGIDALQLFGSQVLATAAIFLAIFGIHNAGKGWDRAMAWIGAACFLGLPAVYAVVTGFWPR